MKYMVSCRPKHGTGPFFKFFRCSHDFITQKVYFSWVNASLRWFNKVSGVQVSLLLIGQRGLGNFFRYHRSLLPILAGGLCKFYDNARRKRIIHHQPLLVHYQVQQQANPLLSINNNTRETVPFKVTDHQSKYCILKHRVSVTL
jgi:hypothetical protein